MKTKIFDAKFSKYLQAAFQIRNLCDYDDFFIAPKQDAEVRLECAKEFLEAVQQYLETRG